MVWVGREKRTRLWDVNVPGGFGAAGGGPGSTMGNVISMQCHTTSTSGQFLDLTRDSKLDVGI